MADTSFVDVVTSNAIVVEVGAVGGVPMQQRHGLTGYSRRGSVAGVGVFGVFCCWQWRSLRWRLGSRLQPRLSMSVTPIQQEYEPRPRGA